MQIIRTARSVPRTVNKILGSLSPEQYEQLLPHLELVELKRGMSLQRQGAPLEHVYFPGGGICSIGRSMEDGETVIIAAVGNEGLLGDPLFTAGCVATVSSIVQVPCDTALRLSVGAFDAERDRRGVFHRLVSRSSEMLAESVIQTTACNRLHTITQRLPRWLLMFGDRLNGGEIPVTQETLALMLGVRRASVTLAASVLQATGVISYRRRSIRILDRDALESESCECYRAMRARSLPDVVQTIASPHPTSYDRRIELQRPSQ